jgi:hypothetical protein
MVVPHPLDAPPPHPSAVGSPSLSLISTRLPGRARASGPALALYKQLPRPQLKRTFAQLAAQLRFHFNQWREGRRTRVTSSKNGDEAWLGGGTGGGELLRGLPRSREPQEEREEHPLPRLLRQHLHPLPPRAPTPPAHPGK